MQNQYFTKLVHDLSNRTISGVMSWLNVANLPLRQHLFDLFNSPYGEEGSFIANPVFEPVFSWRAGNKTLEELGETLLSPDLINALDNPFIPPEKLKEATNLNSKIEDYRFSRSIRPYKHQIESWEVLSSSDTKSLVVTSGTGSGKTECFMVPILDSLIRESKETKKPLEGVQALFLYPLNALINSQKDRLLAWTGNFNRNVRFCLYNGNTIEDAKNQSYPSEVPDRKTLRESPPPILVTNATMLEYMLVRNEDQSIIQKSKGKLKWIVLDEAHSYVGSQAAELSLLIRRVIHAFDVKPQDIRFIATSATIGNPEGEAGKALKQFLADVGGIDVSQVELRYGVRDVPPLSEPKSTDSLSLEQLEAINNQEDLYKALISNPTAYKLRRLFIADNQAITSPTNTLTLNEICKSLFGTKSSYSLKEHETALRWIDILSNSKNEKEVAYLPLRSHIFHQTMTGLWACVDPNCSEKHQKSPKLVSKEWPFGQVYLLPRKHCLCSAPIYEVIFCDECGEVYLNAQENGVNIIPFQNTTEIDEFELEREVDEDETGDESNKGSYNRLLISNRNFSDKQSSIEVIDKTTCKYSDSSHENSLEILFTSKGETLECPSCEASFEGKQSKIKNARVGTPYLLGGILPTLLEYAPDGQDDPINKPYKGRRLLTFNDSRQGTARIATKLQQDAERSKVRSWIYHQVNQFSKGQEESPTVKLLRMMILSKEYASSKSQLESQLEAELAKSKSHIPAMPFKDLKKSICNQGADFSRIQEIYKNYSMSTFGGAEGADHLAEMLIFRELARRPRKSNNLETLGLISLQYPGINKIERAPQKWGEFKLGINDWHDFLKICMDFYVRAGSSLDLNGKEWRNWLAIRLPSNWLRPQTASQAKNTRLWPTVKRANTRSILVGLLQNVLNVDPKSSYGKDIIDDLLAIAWNDLTSQNLLSSTSDGYILKLESLNFSVPEKLWICPYSRRFLDVTLNGYSPYTPIHGTKIQCKSIELPRFPQDKDLSSPQFLIEAREWILENQIIRNLREDSLWSTYSDQVLESAPFYKTAEHSAQQKSKTLDQYERQFKSGELNILSCSTTMEMGIDIGGIQLVAMNNVPPHPANYLQRAGRAGRRSETKSASVTLCRANPHDQHIFASPLWAFNSKFPTPRVSLSSESILQRHINSFLLGLFLNNYKNKLKLTSGEFFIETEGPWYQFKSALNSLSENRNLFESGINTLKKNSPYEHLSYVHFLNATASHIHIVWEAWQSEWLSLIQEQIDIKASEGDPAYKAIETRKKRQSGEYLLRDLANYGFLPGYGFPTSLVTFNNLKPSSIGKENGNQREDNRSFRADLPTRDMVTALREYAPGSDLVIDGSVYRSAGITLNWHTPVNTQDLAKTELQLIKYFWRCHLCGGSGVTAARNHAKKCINCNTQIKESNLTEYIEPAGFSVDFYEPLTNDISKQKFIKPEKPVLSINSQWSPLKNPNLGRYRSSNNGRLFYHSKGEHNKGYALCLTCGRSEPMLDDDVYPVKLNPKGIHDRLIAKKDNKQCSGSHQEWSIKKGISFGFETFTDVLEYQLKDINGNWLNNPVIANTLGVAFRNALAEELGIQSSELGVAVEEIKHNDGNHVHSIYLFDENNAGYCSNADHVIENIFQNALRNLNCERSCDSACPSCLLDFEHRHDSESLNRITAQDFLNSKWLEAFKIPVEYSYFGDSSVIENRMLTEAVYLEAKKATATEINLILGASYQDMDLATSSLRELVFNLTILRKKTNLIVHKDALVGMHEDNRLSLFGLYGLPNIDVLVVNEMPRMNQSHIIAEVIHSRNQSKAWSIENASALIANEAWGHADIIVKGAIKESLISNATTAKKEDFNLQSNASDKEVVIHNHLDGKICSFGKRFWEYLRNQHSPLADLLNKSTLIKVEYSDKYLFTPISLAVLKEIVVGLRENVGLDSWHSVPFHILTMEKKAYAEYKGPSGKLFSDWLNSGERNRVLENIFREVGIPCSIQSTQQHSRALNLYFANQKTLTIRLDQGVSYWRVKSTRYSNTENNYFDFDLDEKQQALNILKLKDNEIQGSNMPTELFLKVR